MRKPKDREISAWSAEYIPYEQSGGSIRWLDAADHLNESQRREYFVHLISLLAHRVTRQVMEEVVSKAMPRTTSAPAEPKR